MADAPALFDFPSPIPSSRDQPPLVRSMFLVTSDQFPAPCSYTSFVLCLLPTACRLQVTITATHRACTTAVNKATNLGLYTSYRVPARNPKRLITVLHAELARIRPFERGCRKVSLYPVRPRTFHHTHAGCYCIHSTPCLRNELRQRRAVTGRTQEKNHSDPWTSVSSTTFPLVKVGSILLCPVHGCGSQGFLHSYWVRSQ